MRTICPVCGGGKTKERSCQVYDRSGVAWYKCYRASCPRPSGPYDGQVNESHAVELKLPYRTKLSRDKLRWLAEQFALTDDDLARLRPMWAEGRVWYPTYNQHGIETGGVARSYDGKIPKALTYTQDWSVGSWYLHKNSSRIVLVEDQVSACKVARHYTCVALLGAAVHKDLQELLVGIGKPVTVALDGDAFDKAIRISDRLQSAGLSTTVVYLDLDLKHKDADVWAGITSR